MLRKSWPPSRTGARAFPARGTCATRATWVWSMRWPPMMLAFAASIPRLAAVTAVPARREQRPHRRPCVHVPSVRHSDRNRPGVADRDFAGAAGCAELCGPGVRHEGGDIGSALSLPGKTGVAGRRPLAGGFGARQVTQAVRGKTISRAPDRRQSLLPTSPASGGRSGHGRFERQRGIDIPAKAGGAVLPAASMPSIP